MNRNRSLLLLACAAMGAVAVGLAEETTRHFTRPGEPPPAAAAGKHFQQWRDTFQRAPSAALLHEGRRLAEERRRAVKDLLQSDPRLACETALTASQRRGLPAEVAGLLEERISGVGDIRVTSKGPGAGVSADGLARTVTIGGRTFAAHVYGWRLVDQDFVGVPLHGVVVDGVMAVLESPMRVLEPEEAPAGKGKPGQVVSAVGDKVLVFDTPDEAAAYERGLMHPLGMKVPGARDLEAISKINRVRRVRPNELARQRINVLRQQKGLRPLSSEELNVAPRSNELVTEDGPAPGGPEPAPTTAGSADNSQLQYFPPIRSQGSIGSCACFSTTYYQMTHMTAMARGWDAKNGGDSYRFSPKWTYDMVNGGNDMGSMEYWSLNVQRDHGCATWAEFPYDSDYRAWCLNSNTWRSAISRRMNNYYTIAGLYMNDGLANLKAVLDNGYVVTFDTYAPWSYQGWVKGTVGNDPATGADDAYVGQQICKYVRALDYGHAMTIVGYNDDIWVDLNGNGVVDSGEKGALKIANSWGTSFGNGGYAWFAYDALKTDSAVSGWNPPDKVYGFGYGDTPGNCQVYVVTAQASYSPQMIAQFTVRHGLRNQMTLKVGKDNTAATNNPATTWTPYGLSGDGGPYAFDGTATPCDGTFCLDLMGISPMTNELKRYFVGLADNSSDTSTGLLKAVTFMNLVNSNTVTVTTTANPGSFNPADGVANGTTAWGWADYTFRWENLDVSLPVRAFEDDGVLTGQGSIDVKPAPSNNLVVSLSSSDPTEVRVTNAVTILASQTHATFDIAIVDDAELDGTQWATIMATATGYPSGSTTVAVHDNESAALSLVVTATATEGAGVMINAGTVTVSAAVAANVAVTLASSDPSEVTVPSNVTVLAGQTSASFNVTVLDDTRIDGAQSVMVTAHVVNWTDGSAAITVLDNESTNLTMGLPVSGYEGQVLTNGGWVTISGTLPSNLVVNLGSDDTNVVVVPNAVTVLASRMTAYFNVSLPPDGLTEGTKTGRVTASAAGFAAGSASMPVRDRDADHFGFSAIAGPQAAGTPFSVTLSAQDINGTTIAVYQGTVALSGAGDHGPVTMTPANALLINGVWSRSVRVNTPDTNVRLTANDGLGHSGTSTPFNVMVGPLDHFAWGLIPSPQHMDVPFPAAVIAKDAGENMVTNFTGKATFSGWGGSLGASQLFADDFEDGNYDGWTLDPGNYYTTREVTSQTAAGGIYSFTQIGGYGHCNGVSHTLDNLTPSRINFCVRAASTSKAGGYFVIGTGPETLNIAVFFLMSGGTMGIYENAGGGHGVPYAANQWYKISLLFDWANKKVDYYVNDAVAHTNIPFRGSTVTNLTVVYLYNYNDTQAWWDEIEFIHDPTPPAVSITPTNSGAFVNGVWTGAVAVLEAASNLCLRANDGSGHSGASGLFTVEAFADLGITMKDSPDPVIACSNLTYSISVSNSGPDKATGVRVSDPLPATVNFVSAGASQGTCTKVSGTVTWNVGVVSNGASATATIVVVPTFAGPLTNTVTLTADSTDSNPDNNVTGALTTVTGNGVLDHFSWDQIAPTQYVGSTFPVTVIAKHVTDQVLSSFTGTVALSGWSGQVTTNILGNRTASDGSNVGLLTLGYSFTPTTNITVTHVRHYSGVKVSIWTDAGVLLASQNVNSVPGTWLETRLAVPVQLSAGTRYRVGVFSGGGSYNWETDMSSSFSYGTINESYQISGDAFPTSFDSKRWPFVDLRYTVGLGDPVAISPSNSTSFVGGVWTGNVTILQQATNAYLRADDGAEHSGTSGVFNVRSFPPLKVTVPANATEGDGVLTNAGRVSIPGVQASNTVIALVSTDLTEVQVTNTVTILAGQTNAVFNITVMDDLALDGTQWATITASAAGYGSGSAMIAVTDNEIATLSLSVPASAREGDGVLANAGTVTVSAAVATNVLVSLASSDPSEVTVPGSVTVVAGQTLAAFNVTVVDDSLIDGLQTAWVTAHVQNWVDASNSTTVLDNDSTNLVLTLPASGYEGQMFTNGGRVAIGGTLASNLAVALVSADTSEVQVTGTVTIVAGQTSVLFNVTLPPDGVTDGVQTGTVTASAAGFAAGSASMPVRDADVDHYVFGPISSPQTSAVPFSVRLAAADVNGATIAVYRGSVGLSGSGDSGPVTVQSTNITNFVSGVWTGNVIVVGLDANVRLTANDGLGHSGASTSFNVAAGPLHHFAWGPVATQQYVNVSFPATITAQDAWNNTATGFTGIVALAGNQGGSGKVTTNILGNPTYSYRSSGSFTLGYSFTPTNNITVTHVRHYSGTKVSIWTDAGVRLASQNVSSVSGTWLETPLAVPVQLLAGTRYRVGFYTGGVSYYGGTDMSSNFACGTIHQSYSGFGDSCPVDANWVRWWFVDLRYTVGSDATAVAISPTNSGNFVSGVWSGNVTVQQQATNMCLRADDGAGHSGTSGVFSVGSFPPLKVTVPAIATEGDGVLTNAGRVSISGVLTTDLVVTLVFSDPTEVTVTNTVTIPAGQTNTFFNITIVDDLELDGMQWATITVTAAGYGDTSGMIAVNDNDFATLNVSVPAGAREGDGVLVNAGTVTVSATVATNVAVSLTSSDQSEVTVPSNVTVLMGQTSAVFNITVVDDTLIDGTQSVTVTAHVVNWTDGGATITVLDNESTNLTLTLPASGYEGQVFTNGGRVAIGGTLASNLAVTLVSADTSEVQVPGTVTILAGQTSVLFNVTLPLDGLTDGVQTGTVTASAAGFAAGSASMPAQDADVDHYVFGPVSSPQIFAVPFSVRLAAADVNGATIAIYRGSVGLSGTGDSGPVTVQPTNLTNFVNGVWTGSVTMAALDANVRLTASDAQCHSGTSTPFNVVVGLLHHFAWGAVATQQYVNVPIPVTVKAQDAGNNTVTGFTGIVALAGYQGGSGKVATNILGNPSYSNPDSYSGWYTLGYAFTPNTNITVTHVRHYSGVKVSIWTDAGVLLASQNVSSVAGTWLETPLAIPVQLSAGTRYRVGVYTGGGSYYWRVDLSSNFPYGTINQSYQASWDAFPTYSDLNRWWFVDLRYTAGSDETAVAISPANSGNFVSGVWSGSVTVLQEATNIYLRADDGAEHSGTSRVFSVGSRPPLKVTVPASATEGDDVMTNAGWMCIPGVLTTDLVVALVSSDPTEVTVTNTVTIRAGQTNAFFDLVIVDDAEMDGSQTATITASASVYGTASATIAVADNDVHHFDWSLISSPKTAAAPFCVTISARNINGVVITTYSNTVQLSATCERGAMPIQPIATGPFASGVWTGAVSVADVGSSVLLAALDVSGPTGNSNPFKVVPVFGWDPIPSPQGVGVPFAVTITAKDALGFMASNFTGVVNLHGLATCRLVDACFENGMDGLVISNGYGTGGGLWHRTTARMADTNHSAAYSLYYGQGEGPAGGGNYDAGHTEGAVVSTNINLSGVAAPVTLSFKYLLETEPNPDYDHVTVEVSRNGGLFQDVAGNKSGVVVLADPTSNKWRMATVDLSAFIGSTIRILFHFNTVGLSNNGYEGWYLDDVVVSTGDIVPVPIAPNASGAFDCGIWTGSVAVMSRCAEARLAADWGGEGCSMCDVFDVLDFKSLEILSAHDGALPSTGTNSFPYGTHLVCAVTNSPVADGAGTQCVCIAGAVAGNDYTTVSPTNVTLTLTNDATLTWQWQTQYRLTMATNGNGTVTAADGWYDSGAEANLTATAAAHWHFTGWSGDTNGCGTTGNVITVAMTQTRSITANFLPVISVTPSSWDFGSVQIGSGSRRTFTVQNIGTGTLVGVASVGAPFSVLPPSNYNLSAGQSQVVTVRYKPLATGSHSNNVIFTGEGGTTRPVTGTGTKGDQTITFTDPGEQLRAARVVLQAQASSGLPVKFAVLSGPGLITASQNLSFTGIGEVWIAARQSGNAYWNAAPQVVVAINVINPAMNDYDGDGISDLAMYTSAGGGWNIKYSGGGTTNVNWGFQNSTAVCGDYDGDGKADLAVFYNVTGRWYIRTLDGRTLAYNFAWGWPSAKTVSGDYDGDGRDDFAVYDENTGKWYIWSLAKNRMLAWNLDWGWPGAKPVSGDYDGDRRSDLAVLDVNIGHWYIYSLATEKAVAWNVAWGWTGGAYIPGDFDGDGKSDLAVCDQATHTQLWYIYSLAAGKALAWKLNWGVAGGIPVSGDYDGDGKTDFAVYDQNAGKWYIRNLVGELLMMDQMFGGGTAAPVKP